eukprot:TRINITY_DN20039_c0_g1_i1.p1 TRINITY_DN20039_c0_g1~~TRINITY_DN20039_c0_g1_i1.p1  ORF type:complete len:585 (+),score=94.11 TRINITY_DN20039_c0_g1_i1:139-1893(+)
MAANPWDCDSDSGPADRGADITRTKLPPASDNAWADEVDSDDLPPSSPAAVSVERSRSSHSRSRSPRRNQSREQQGGGAAGDEQAQLQAQRIHSYLSGAGPAQDLCDPKQPELATGIEWWAPIVWQGLLHIRRKRPESSRPIIWEDVCGGTMGLGFGLQAMNIPFEINACADKKFISREFISHNFNAKHIFQEAFNMIEKSEPEAEPALRRRKKQCKRCDRFCLGPACEKACSFEPGDTQPDLVTAGLPCQPFSSMRQKKTGKTPGTGPPRLHKGFSMLRTLVQYICARRPRGFILEEVTKVLTIDPTTQESYLKGMLSEICELGYGCAAAEFSAGSWSDCPRDRIYVVGVLEEFGGEPAAMSIMGTAQEVNALRKLNEPTSIWKIIGFSSRENEARDRAAKELLEDEATRSASPTMKWELKSQAERQRLMMPFRAKPWTGRRSTKLTGLCQVPRVIDLLDVAFEQARAKVGYDKPPEETVHNLWIDASQSHDRAPWSWNMRAICQRSAPYCYKHDVALSGLDFMALQGFPQEPAVTPDRLFSDRTLKSLAGEAFFVPSITTLAYAFYLHDRFPWWESVGKCSK